MHRKSILVLSSCCHFQPPCFPVSLPPTTPPSWSSGYNPHRRKRAASQRHYATAQRHNVSPSSSDDLPWPDMPTPTTTPTPYQIFQLTEKAPYSKHRFYELVKLYHPDRHAHCCNVPEIDSLSPTAKMKRYRLVVAANDILSDPARRRAYDHFGAGWSSHPDVGGPSSAMHSTTQPRWSGFHDNNSPARNATWEDWEKWYARNSKQAQEPVYTSNGGFISLVAFVAALSALSQASRVDEHQQYFADRIELVHNDCHESIQRRKDKTKELSKSEMAILRFMRSREQGGMPAGCGDSPHDNLDRAGLLPPER